MSDSGSADTAVAAKYAPDLRPAPRGRTSQDSPRPLPPPNPPWGDTVGRPRSGYVRTAWAKSQVGFTAWSMPVKEGQEFAAGVEPPWELPRRERRSGGQGRVRARAGRQDPRTAPNAPLFFSADPL